MLRYNAFLYILLFVSVDSFFSNLDLFLPTNITICDNWYVIENDTDEYEHEENVGEDIGDKTRRFNIYDNVNTELNGPTCWCNHGAEGKAGGVEMRKGRCWQQQWSGTGMMHIDPSGTHMLTSPVFFS